ncbi:MAG TPA: carbohydrate binding domain-containing protein [bacterium]|nr:carbohydrate binding domain-containing protein [bacterium]
MKRFYTFLASILLAGGFTNARAEISLPAIFGDHMVLQQGTPSVWGKAKAGKTITLTLGSQTTKAKVGKDGKWKASFTSLEAGGPNDLVISGDGAVTLSDVLVGEVWLGSGQSNMEFPMRRTHDAAIEIPKADNSQIRLFTVEHAFSGTPQEDLKGKWVVCTPDSVKEFSAVAYHFGKDLQEALKVPVGLVVSCWGGTDGECWTPREALDKEPHLAQLAKDWDESPQAKAWKEGLPYEVQLSGIRFIPKGGGEPLTVLLQPGGKGVGGTWNTYINPGSTGTYTAKGQGPDGGPAASLSGTMKGGCWITLQTNLQSSGALDLSKYEAVEFSAKGNGPFRLKLGQASIGDYDYYTTDILSAASEWKTTKVPLASLKQGGWGAPKPFTPEAIQSLIITVEVPYNPEVASVIYNSMIAPMTGFGIHGAFWYQGEANAGRASDYHALLKALIGGWRAAWGSDFPFLITQLPNFMQVKPEPSESSWAELREAQLKALDIPGTGIVTTIDLGEADNIHPTNKTEVGRRLSLVALKQVYGKTLQASGPMLATAVVKGGKMVLTFKETGKGLAGRDGKPVTGFALVGDDGDFHWAKAKIVDGNTLEVSSDAVKAPVEVRYAWADNPICNLVNQDGLPASPFRFSTQPMATQDNSSAFEPWKSVDPSNAGAYQDDKGSTLTFTTDKGPEKGQRALHMTYNLKAGGYCGLWHNTSFDLSKATTIVFKAKATLPGELQFEFKDKYNVQYMVKVKVPSAAWSEVRIPVVSFIKNPYYTPPNAELGHPMDLSKVNGMNVGPQADGAGEMWIGPVSAEDGASGATK